MELRPYNRASMPMHTSKATKPATVAVESVGVDEIRSKSVFTAHAGISGIVIVLQFLRSQKGIPKKMNDNRDENCESKQLLIHGPFFPCPAFSHYSAIPTPPLLK